MSAQCSNCRRQDRGRFRYAFFIGVTQRMDSPLFCNFDRDMNQIEWGINPDVKIDMKSEDEVKGIDTIIEKARELLK